MARPKVLAESVLQIATGLQSMTSSLGVPSPSEIKSSLTTLSESISSVAQLASPQEIAALLGEHDALFATGSDPAEVRAEFKRLLGGAADLLDALAPASGIPQSSEYVATIRQLAEAADDLPDPIVARFGRLLQIVDFAGLSSKIETFAAHIAASGSEIRDLAPSLAQTAIVLRTLLKFASDTLNYVGSAFPATVSGNAFVVVKVDVRALQITPLFTAPVAFVLDLVVLAIDTALDRHWI